MSSSELIAQHQRLVAPHQDEANDGSYVLPASVRHAMTKAWDSSNAGVKNAYLSFLSDAWMHHPSAIGPSLDALPRLNWSVTRHRCPWWMELFVLPKGPFELTSKAGQTAFAAWWSRRASSVSTTTELWEPVSSLDPQATNLMQEPSQAATPRSWRTWMITRQLDSFVSATLSATPSSAQAILSALAALAAQQEALGVPRQFNQWAGTICERISLSPQDASPASALNDFRAQHALTLHQSPLSIAIPGLPPTWSTMLMGAPEYLFKQLSLEVATQSKTSELDRISPLFWAACRSRWDQRPADVSSPFFLPSMLALMAKSDHMMRQTAHKEAWSAFVSKIILSGETNLWSWSSDIRRPGKAKRM